MAEEAQVTAALSDDYPVLLGPVRVEYRFTDAELLVRVFPDDWQVDTFEPERTARESDHAMRFWAAYWEAGGDHDERLDAWRVLAAHVGPGRARHLADTRRPLNPGDEPRRTSAGQVILVVATDDPIPAGDRTAAAAYWRAVYQAGGTAPQAADQALVHAIGQSHADKVRAHPPAHLDREPRTGDRAHADVTVAFCDLPTVAATDTRPTTWMKPAHARLLPDAFTLLGYVNGQEVLNVTGTPIPADLAVGPDPAAPAADQFQATDGALHVPGPLKWLVDFDTAVANGMGFRIPLTDALRRGLDRLVVLGLRGGDPATSKADLETLIDHQALSRTGFQLLPQGTPTNNTGKVQSGLGSGDADAEAFAAQVAPAASVDTPMDKPDGQWLAELLGIDPAVVAAVPGADGTDQREARAMNRALWPATWGYHLGTMLNPMFGTPQIDATRTFFTQYVSGRGPVPAFRIGKQPYGVVVTTAFSRMAWADTDPAAGHRRALHTLLTPMASDWNDLARFAPQIGLAAGNPDGMLLGMLALQPSSVEFYQRYAQSIDDYFNRENLTGNGAAAIQNALVQLLLPGRVTDLLARLGYPAGLPQPDAAGRLFTGRQHAMKGAVVDDRPLSETDPVRAYTGDGRNYLEWLATTAFDAVRTESGFAGDPPGALLYLYLRHAVLNGYAEAALRLAAAAHGLADPAVVAERHEAPFLHISVRTRLTESRYGRLYQSDPAITGDDTMLVVDYVPAALEKNDPATRDLADQLAALTALEQVPTARLERVFAEHIDTCRYRMDAWRLGLANEKLFALRYPPGGTGPVTGVHLGAYGYLEEVRPRAKPLTPVTLTGDLAEVFNGAAPLVHDPANQGFIHAPSMAQATTAALLRAGYLANATPDNPGALAVNLSSGRVRTALALLDGIRAGQSLGALLGYRFERGLHDGYAIAETDRFINALRGAFPLVAAKLAETAPPDGTAIDQIEARNVVDGLALVRQITRTGQDTYPFGAAGLPPADATQTDAISGEARRLIEINDALADLAVAESVHQVAQGNPERSAAAMDAFTKTGNPPDPDVVRTPRTGHRLTHRFGLHLQDGLAPKTSPAAGVPMTPRGNGDPAVDRWLAGLLPKPADVAVNVVWTDPGTSASKQKVITQADLDLQPIDLLWALRPAEQATMTDLDDRIVGRLDHAENLRGDVEPVIRYTDRIAGKITFFELSPLVDALRQLLLAGRSARPSDYIVPADGQPYDPHADDAVNLPRNRPQAVRDALDDLRADLADFVHDIGVPLADPVAHRNDLLTDVDTFLTRYGDLLLTAGGCGLVRSGWGELVQWRRLRFADVFAAVQTATDRMTASLAAAGAKITQYDALPSTAADDVRFALLQQAERLLTTAPTSPRPNTPKQLRTTVNQRRTAFTNRLTALTAIAHTTRPTLSGLLSDVAALLPISQFDATGLDLTPVQDAVVTFCTDLAARAQNLLDELTTRLAAVDAALTQYDAATTGPDRVTAATAAIRAGLGPDALATAEFDIPDDLQQPWKKVYTAGKQGKLTQHLSRDFPVDDWMHGLARVRPRMALWERITLLAGAVGQEEPDLIPVQFPYATGDPWLGLEIPDTFPLADDRLLHTTHYADTFSPGGDQCALLLDEWTETIPATTITTGIAAHYDRPSTQPPQTMLLVAPPVRTGAWNADDLVAAIAETMDLARARVVEPDELDSTPYAQLLPATVMSAAFRPVTIATDLSANNDAPVAGGPFRPARG